MSLPSPGLASVAPMSENSSENSPGTTSGTGSDPSGLDAERRTGIEDEQLPEDLVAGERNPLAEGLPPGEGADLLEGGKTADEMDTEQDEADKQAGPAHEND